MSGSTGLVTGESYSLTQNVLKLSYTAGSTTSTFLLDIYKMTKGEQNKGAYVKFQFVTQNAPLRQPRKAEGAEWPWVSKPDQDEYTAARERVRSGNLIDDTLAARLKSGTASRSTM